MVYSLFMAGVNAKQNAQTAAVHTAQHQGNVLDMKICCTPGAATFMDQCALWTAGGCCLLCLYFFVTNYFCSNTVENARKVYAAKNGFIQGTMNAEDMKAAGLSDAQDELNKAEQAKLDAEIAGADNNKQAMMAGAGIIAVGAVAFILFSKGKKNQQWQGGEQWEDEHQH